MKKFIAIFLVFFLGTCCLIAIDGLCKETANSGGDLGLCIKRTGGSQVTVTFLGLTNRFKM